MACVKPFCFEGEERLQDFPATQLESNRIFMMKTKLISFVTVLAAALFWGGVCFADNCS